MYTVTINGEKTFKTELSRNNNRFEGTLDGNPVSGDLLRVNEHQYHLLINNRSYNVEVLRHNETEKQLVLRINGEKMNIDLKDKYDELLHRLGMDQTNSRKVNEVKAPMPGMVLNVLVSEGTAVKKGDALLVLEAMKMENILKSPCDGTIKKVAASKGSAVEKNQLLIQF